jgi:nucleoside-diphosphate-sugar epimerase
MRVMVTGHKGYIGTVMAPMLQKNGHDVIGLDNDLFEECIFGDPTILGKMPKIQYIKKDIRKVELSDLKKCDAVIHLCALSNDPLGYFNPEITYNINYEASVKLAKLAKKAKIQRFLFTSSCSVYGDSGDSMVTEESKTRPITPYAISKMRAENDIRKLTSPTFCPTFLRPATAYGVSPMLRFDLVLNNLTAWAYTTGVILLKSDGTAFRPIVHIEDISRAFISVLNAPMDIIQNEVFNVGITKENYQVKELANIVKEIVPGSEVKFAKDAEPDKRSYTVSFDKIANNLSSFKPQWNARLGAKQLYDTYKRVGFTLEDFEGPRYRRISHLEKIVNSGRLDKTLQWNGNE